MTKTAAKCEKAWTKQYQISDFALFLPIPWNQWQTVYKLKRSETFVQRAGLIYLEATSVVIFMCKKQYYKNAEENVSSVATHKCF